MSKPIGIDKIRTDGGTQPRSYIDAAVVDDYATAMEDGADFPPPIVFYDGTDYWLADGFHRFEAKRQNGNKTVKCDVRQGTQRDAVLFSVGANATHGMRRTNADKRRAVLVLLNDSEWSTKSDRWIADHASVSNRFVSNLRPTVNGSQSHARVGMDGRAINTSNIGRKPTVWVCPSCDHSWPMSRTDCQNCHNDERTEETTVINGDTGELIENPVIEKTTRRNVKFDKTVDTGVYVYVIPDDIPHTLQNLFDELDAGFLLKLSSAITEHAKGLS